MIKQLIEQTNKPLLFVGGYNALIAYIAELAGADGIWLSSFELSACHGLPDADMVSTDEYSRLVDSITDTTDIPLLVDANEGHGNALSVMKLVRDYEKNGANGIVIEDNLYPKENSFYKGDKRLENPHVFCGKLLAAKDNTSDNFFVGARTEAFIAGFGLEDALERALLYEQYADAIIVHSKMKIDEEVRSFAVEWKKVGKKPLICIPTTYNHVNYLDLYDLGYKLLILANYGLRSSVKAIREVYDKIVKGKSLSEGNELVCSMKEIFDLVFVDTFKETEKKFIGDFEK